MDNYSWPYAWKNMGERTPKMDAMLQSIMDEDVENLRYLRSIGASLINSDEGTLKRLLFEKIGALGIMKVLIEEEYITSFISAD